MVWLAGDGSVPVLLALGVTVQPGTPWHPSHIGHTPQGGEGTRCPDLFCGMAAAQPWGPSTSARDLWKREQKNQDFCSQANSLWG